MKRKKKLAKQNNLEIVIVFVIFVTVLLVASVAVKVLHVISQSKYDGVHMFVVEVDAKKSTDVIAFSPDRGSISIASVGFKSSDTGKLLAVPIDGRIRFKNTHNEDSYDNLSELPSKMQQLLLHYKDLDTNLTIIDVLRLFLYTKSISGSDIVTKEITVSTPDALIDKVASTLFSDSSITSEKLAIEIINGTDISGLGGRLDRFLSHIGANVIAVRTSEKPIKNSEVECLDEKKYTCERIRAILGFPLLKDNAAISDVIIRIGEDKVRTLPF